MPTLESASGARRTARVAAQRRRTRLVSLVVAPTLVLGTIAAGIWGATAASAAPLPAPAASIALQSTGGAHGDADDKPFILAGEDATFDVSLTNASGGAGGYNIGFTLLVPNGIDLVASGLGTPVVYASGATLPNSSKTQLATVPAGFQLWVFEDVADLPATADYTSTITVRPDAAVFPVGAAPAFVLDGYVSSQASVKPIFDGSTGVGGAAALAETSSGESQDTAPVRALRLTKSEPSPEIELLRGVHQNQTVYTLTVENTPQGRTDAVTLVDYLPAGLEFLGCATTDNTQPSALLSDGTLEYPGSGDVTGTDPGDCLAPVSVETVNTDLPADLDPGVYTKVTWELPALDGAVAQSFPTAAGTPGVTTIRYVAAVPLFENTMDFVTDAGTGTPSAASGEQGANLNNNNGPSTRQGQGAGYDDGIRYRNSATVAGTYAGPLAAGASAEVSDTDTEDIQAMDLRILKSVDTGNGNEFVTGGLALFTLDIATSEYTSADEMTVTDVIPNGLCPVFPANAPTSGDTFPAECASTPAGASLTGATVDDVNYDATAGTFTVTFTPTPDALAAQSGTVISYTVLMRPDYDTHDRHSGNTSSGDDLTNVVEIQGMTHAIAPLDGVTNGSGVPAYGDQDVWDDSSATIDSGYSGISKRVLSRDAVIPGADAATSCAVPTSSAAWHENQNAAGDQPFHLGDVVCYELTVDFATQIDVRDPLVTDFLPSGVAYLDSSVAAGTSPGVQVPAASVSGQRLDWAVGTVGADGDRFVPLGSKLVLHVLGRVTSMTPNDEPTLDKPENLMKYQQENVLGDVFFLRDSSAIQTGQAPTLLKGVRDVDGDASLPARTQDAADGTVFDSNRDGIQVVAGDVATFRVDLTGGDTDVTDLVVWDALPAGITKSAVAVTGGTALDPGDAGYPAGFSAAGRSVIVWTGIDLPASAERTLTYTVTIPVGVEVNVDLVNTASITQYDVALNTGETETFFPSGSLDGSSHPDDRTVPGAASRDDSDVYTPDPRVDKELTGTEIGPDGTIDPDPNNGDTVVVQGEYATFTYDVTIPAHTTVTNAVLQDRGTVRVGSTNTYVPLMIDAEAASRASWTSPAGVDRSGFTFTAIPSSGTAKGVLRFPASYTNATDDEQVFAVTLVAYVGDAGNNNTTLTNRAQFTSATWNGQSDAETTYREPNLVIDKQAAPVADVAIGTPVDYTLRVTNNTNRVISYDNVVTDHVPAGLLVDLASIEPAPASVDAGVATGAGGDIVWNIAQIPATATLGYTAVIDPATGGGEQYRNVADVTGYTLPSTLPDAEDRRGTRTDDDDATITATTATITKGVRIAGSTGTFAASQSAPIGEEVQYRVLATLQPNINYYDVEIVDTLPVGVVPDESTLTAPVADPAGSVPGTWTAVYDAASRTITWTLDGGTIASAGDVRTLALEYDATVTPGVAAGTPRLDNVVALEWNTVDGDDDTRQGVDDEAQVDVLQPVPAIAKTVSNEAPNPGDTFDYTVTVTNTGTTEAYNLVVTDEVPTGVVVDPDTITRGGVLTGTDADGSGGTITWDQADLPGPLYRAGDGTPASIVLTYSATLAPSGTLAGDASYENTARVTHLESFPTGGREYDPTDVSASAEVDPPFPFVTLTKTTTGSDVAYADESFGWTLTLVNTGDGPADTVAVSDVLPKNWTYDAGSARITVGTAAAAPLADPTVSSTGGVQSLAWPASAVSSATPVLPGTATGASTAQRTIVVTFTATPTVAALTDAGVTTAEGVRIAHTNLLSATTTDTSGATGNADGSYTGADDTADAFLHSADVVLVKEPGTGLVAGGAAGTAWTVTVSNDGPDTAVGPFTVTDDWGALPDGFAVTAIAGTGWTITETATGFTAVRTNGADTLASGASFPAITVTGRASAGFDPADSPVANTATVTAATFDPDESNNTDDAEVPVTASADLSILKQGPTTAPNAGGSITWTLTVANNGPSDSVSATGELITVTDTIPEGVDGVTLGTLPTGWSAAAAGPFAAGDTVTLTLDAGLRLTPTQSVAFTLSGTVSASLAEGTEILNSAAVAAGATDDPDPSNNESEVEVTPTTDTTLGVTKTRQVQVDGVWRDATAADPVTPGASVTYLVTVANTGTADARAVTLTDEVPSELTYASFASVDGTWTRTSTTAGAGVDQTFALTGALVPGDTAALRLTFTVNPSFVDAVVNWVQAGAENATNEPRDSDDSDTTRSANLSIVKSHDGDAVAGESLDYTLLVTNHGPSDSSGPIVITDELPEGFGYAGDSATVVIAGGTTQALEPVVDGQTLTWTIGTGTFALAPDAQITVLFTATIADDVPAGVYENVGIVDGPDDTDPSDNTSIDPTTVDTSADLSITKTAAAGPYVAGESVTYTLTVVNAGPSVARDASVVDAVPAGMTVTAIAGDGWTCDVDDAACTRDILPVGTSTLTVTATLAASVADGSELTNTATVGSATPDPTPEDNSDDETVTVDARADLQLVKTAIDADGAEITTADAGTEVRYLIEVTNNGPSDAVGPLTVEDTLPDGFTFVAIEGTGWTCEPGADALVVCTTAAGLPAGASAEDLVMVVAIDQARGTGTAVNTATVSSPTVDPIPENNTDDAPLDVTQSADLSIVKTHDADAVRIGDELAFALDVRNAGPSQATEVTVVDTLPAGLEFVSAGATDPVWTVVADEAASDGTTTVTATLATALDAGATAPALQIVVRVHAEAYPGVENVAVVSGAQPDPTPADNTSIDPVEVPAQATLVVTKTALGAFQVGSDARYRITVTNLGPTEDPGPIVVTDSLPNGLTFRAGSGDVHAEGSTVTWTLPGTLAVGASASVELTVAVGQAAFPSVTNTVTVGSPTEQTPDAALTASATSAVAADPLATTGGTVPLLWLGAGLLLTAAGALLLARRRRV